MTDPRRFASSRRRPSPAPRAGARATVSVAVVFALAACSGGGERKATQVAAKVGDGEVSVHQINHVLQRSPGIAPERIADARKEVLERLIDQELLVQRAKETKLDRDPDVLQRLETARREVLSRAHLERVAAQVPKPDAAAVDRFFAENPALFSERRVWRLNEIVLPGRPPNWSQLTKELEASRTAAEAADILRRRGVDTAVSTNVLRGSENIPLEVLPRFAKLKDGEVAIYQNGPQVVIAEIRSSQPAPLDAKKAGPAIEQFIVNRARSEAVQAEVKRLRETVKVEYRGEFEGGAVPRPAPKAAGSGEKGAIEKGLGGLK